MSDTDNSIVEIERADGIATLRFNRPERLNAMDRAMAEAFHEAVAEVVEDAATRVIILSGAGESFLAGGDLAAMEQAGDDAVAAVDTIIRPAHAAMKQLMAAPQPTIAQLHGAVAGAGMSVAMATDLAVAADNTRFNLAYANIGAVPDCSGSWSLPRLVGMRRAREIALLSETIDADEAKALGLVNRVVPLSQLDNRIRQLAQRLAAGPPVAQGHIKRLLRSSLDTDLPGQLDAEERAFKDCAATQDFRNAVTAFLRRQKPVFTGK
ncbi:enoyl-CoA hydratase-related protein [Aquisalimonas sp.]|uniref:enoyl-CoA hydratase/isomerase family protein n=1 Tax=Aquisalimonas sp. TaxID=1872621 RepID=UPI0025BCCB7E|nr:enoyl-CoA hydratase-related protein [Aquisalimonas sp.]